jgi:hypothetical protein
MANLKRLTVMWLLWMGDLLLLLLAGLAVIGLFIPTNHTATRVASYRESFIVVLL